MRSLIIASIGLLCLQAPAGFGAEKVSFNRDIRQILSDNCLQCHGPDEKKRRGGLRLDTQAGATEVVIVPGDPAASDLLDRIATDDPDLKMPPPKSGKTLSPAQIELFRRWIAEGAEYESHWSFSPVQRPEVPAVQHADSTRNPIDHFIVRQLESRGVALSPEADRVTRIRRLFLDLIGLPPTPEEVDVFVQDQRKDAYEHLVDRLLENPHFGERWGRHWLDHARYADSNGYAPDGARTMWPYRDWVIRAFNDDLPFDRFTIEQLAGDLLPSPTLEQRIATGFHRNTLINTEGGTKADQFRVEQTKDRVDTTGLVWLGLTVGCANCHDHKYDPLKQREYYELFAFFNSTQDQNSTNPVVSVPTPQQTEQLAMLDRQLAEAKAALLVPDTELPARRAAWEKEIAEGSVLAGEWKLCETVARTDDGASFEKLDDGSQLASGINRGSEQYRITLTAPVSPIRSLKLEALKHDSLPSGGPGRAGNGNFVLSKISLEIEQGKPLLIRDAWADHSQGSFDVHGAIDDDQKTGWAINGAPGGGANHDRVAEFLLATPLVVEPGQHVTLLLEFRNGEAAYNLGRFRISASSGISDHFPVIVERRKLAAILDIESEKRTPAQKSDLDKAFDSQDPRRSQLLAAVNTAEQQRQSLARSIPTSMVLAELPKPRDSYVMERGDFLRQGDPVQPDVPEIFPPLLLAQAVSAGDGSGQETIASRLDFARWLVRREHPLTARVYVNRVWLHLFGRGIVETENDFGTQGAFPSHPDLLDWLADDFVEKGWSTKQLIRTIVTSATYRQSSQTRLELDKVDPRNLLLGRQNRLRVEAEIVRDLGLAASGLLTDKIGGPSVFPPQPAGVYAFTQVNKNWTESTGPDRYRRGMYTFFYRSAPHPMLTTFDVPHFDQTCTRRDRSNTPLQSLTVANDAAFYEMTQALAKRAQQEVIEEKGTAKNDKAVLLRMFLLCFARSPTESEQAALLEFQSAQRDHFSAHPDAAAKIAPDLTGEAAVNQAAWTATARVLLNLDEFITRE